jgi:hypothetical protein
MKFLEEDKIQIELSVVSSILNNAGFMGLCDFLALETYKHIIQDEYVNFKKIEPFLINKSEKRWLKSMGKLCDLGLAVNNNGHFISRTKLKDWRQKNAEYQKYGGYIVFDLNEMYRKKENITDLLYLSISSSVMCSNTYSRGWVEKLTGVTPYRQRLIEKRNPDIIQTNQNLQPVGAVRLNKLEEEGKKAVVIKATFDSKNLQMVRGGRINTIQYANKIKCKNLGLAYLKSKKNTINNKPFWRKDEVADWKKIDTVIDTETTCDTTGKLIASNDTCKKTWQGFHTSAFDSVRVLSEKGSLITLRKAINNCPKFTK